MKNLIALLLFTPGLCLAQLPDYVPIEDLYGWYNLDGDAQDASGNGHHGEPQLIQPCNGVTNTSGGVEFTQQNSLIEWASDDWLSLEPQEAMTISIWFKSDFSQSPSHLFGKRSGCSGGNSINYQLAWQNDGFSQLLLLGMSLTMCDGFSAGYDVGSEWTHVVTTYDNGWGAFWVNGQVFSACNSTIGATNSSPFLLGGSGTCAGFLGCMDELGIWSRALSAEEISELYSASSPTFGCTNAEACNFQPDADLDDGSCISCEVLASACGEGTVWDSTLAQCVSVAPPCAPSCGEGTVWDPVNEECIIAIPADLNYDGCVSVNDLLVLLAVHGTCPPYPEWPDEPTDTTWTCGDPLTYWDYDYATVLIGDQCWFAENLRTNTFTNGNLIQEVTENNAWAGLTTGARCNYANDSTNLSTYGLLYNWYAVDDALGLCPAGWHVPTDDEWTMLEAFVTSQGYIQTEGTALKSITGWLEGEWSDQPWYNGSSNGTNDFGFSALPGGYRGMSDINAGFAGHWWSASQASNPEYAWQRALYSELPVVDRGSSSAWHGFSVRCLKD